jgi:hypothetical protein
MIRLIVLALFGIGIGIGFSKEPPLPEAVLKAKDVCLEGKTEDARDTDELGKELEDWGRFRLGIRGYCDVTFALQHAGPGSRILHAKNLDSDRDYLVFTVWDYHTGSRLYRDLVEWPLFAKPVRSAVKRLRLRIYKQEQAQEASAVPAHDSTPGQSEYRAQTKPK